jgi:O-antigen/teichoic acid export membrane protein
VAESSFRNPKLRDARLVAYKAFADAAGKASIFLITVVAARRLSAEAFGIFSLASTLGWMLAVAADCGIQLHVAREVARTPAAAADLLGAWLRVRLWTTAAAIALVMLGLIATQATLAFALPLLLFAIVYGGSGLIEFLHYFYRGLSRSDIESTLTLWQRSTTLVCGIVALLWQPSVTVLALAMLVPIATTLLVSVRIATRLTAPRSAARDGEYSITDDRFVKDVLPIGAGIVLSALYFRIDLFLVQLWNGTEAVALYNAVFRIVDALRLFPAAVLAVALPSLCNAADIRPLRRIAAGVLLFAFAAAALLWVSADWTIPLLYGSRYADAIHAFRILLLAFPLLSLNYALTHQLIGWNGQRAYAALCGGALLVNVALNARLLPAMSIDGAAWATVGTELFLTCGCALALAARSARPVAATVGLPV